MLDLIPDGEKCIPAGIFNSKASRNSHHTDITLTHTWHHDMWQDTRSKTLDWTALQVISQWGLRSTLIWWMSSGQVCLKDLSCSWQRNGFGWTMHTLNVQSWSQPSERCYHVIWMSTNTGLTCLLDPVPQHFLNHFMDSLRISFWLYWIAFSRQVSFLPPSENQAPSDEQFRSRYT